MNHLKIKKKKTICTLIFITKVNSILGVEGTDYKIKYIFGETEQDNNSIELNSAEHSYPNGMAVTEKIIYLKTNKEIVKLELEDEYLIWDNIIINLPEEYENGQKGSIVELFRWIYEDIAEECEFLGKAGYLGVKIFTPNEQLLTDNLIEGIGGNDMYDEHISKNCDHWGYKAGSGGSPFWGIHNRNENKPITNKKPVIEYPAIPYFPSDFHCILKGEDKIDDSDFETHKWDWTFADVNTEKDYVRQRIADFYTELLSLLNIWYIYTKFFTNKARIINSNFFKIKREYRRFIT